MKLIISAGNANMATKAARTAERIGIDIPTDGHSYRVGDVVAQLRVPVGGICLRKTSVVGSELARRLRRDLPFALRFELAKWYSQAKLSRQPIVVFPTRAAVLECLSPGW